MLAALAAHGPDRSAQLDPESPGTPAPSFGHRLLRVTPEDAFEHQPLTSPQGLRLTADLRLDNREDLARALDLTPGEATTLSDSALLLRAWKRWGADCLDHLAGAFAFAVWDAPRQRLFLARDHAGERPLYFHATADLFLFATSARALRACPGVSSELDPRQLGRDLMGLPPEYPRSRFRDIGMLAPGHCLTVEPGRTEYRRYWHPDRLPAVRFPRDQDYAEAFLELFDRAVHTRLRSTGGIASELSAGLDSSSVTASAARLLAARGQSLTAYTAVPVPGFAGRVAPGYLADEGPAAAEVAALYPNVRQVRIDSSGSDMLRELERIFPLLDLPHAAALNAVWSHLILDHAAQSGVRVLLTGALGNFAASYTGSDLIRTHFRGGRLLQTLRTARTLRRIGISSGRNAASITLFELLPWSLRTRLDPLIRGAALDWSALRPDAARSLHALDQLRRYLFTRTGALPYLMSVQFANNQYGDYNAATLAGWRIDTRDPTADRRLFEFCAAIPPEQFVAGDQPRSLIRRAMRHRLPPATLHRTEKGTQSADYFLNLSRIRAGLAAELTRIARSPTARSLIDLDLLQAALDHWPATAEDAARAAGTYQSALPRGLAVGFFVRRTEEEDR